MSISIIESSSETHYPTPYLFRLALISQNKLRNETHYGYKAWEKAINHLIYMDYLKLSRKVSDEITAGAASHCETI